MMANGNTPQRPSPKTPTVGAGSSQREDSPAHPPASFNMAFPTQRFLCHPISPNPRPPPYSLPPRKCCPYGLPSPYEYGGLKPILPFLEGRSDAACRVVVKRMRKERFNHALPVLAVVRFCGEACAALFCPWRALAGGRAFGRGPVRATPATPVSGHKRRAGRSASLAKALRRRQGRAFFPPLSLAIQRKGARGRRGAQPPRLKLGIPCVTHYGLGKTHLSDAALLGRALATLSTSPTKHAIANLAD